MRAWSSEKLALNVLPLSVRPAPVVRLPLPDDPGGPGGSGRSLGPSWPLRSGLVDRDLRLPFAALLHNQSTFAAPLRDAHNLTAPLPPTKLVVANASPPSATKSASVDITFA